MSNSESLTLNHYLTYRYAMTIQTTVGSYTYSQSMNISVVLCSQNNWLQWNQDATVSDWDKILI